MPSQPHVIVVGNEKGGSGKSTTAFHLAIQLLYHGFRVASIDADGRQQTMTQLVRNRRDWARRRELKLPHTTHFHLPVIREKTEAENRRLGFDLFRQAVVEVEQDVDFLIVDTPGFDTHLSRLAHSMADTLVTPLNDSAVDLDVIARFDALTGEVRELSHYARLVQQARRDRANIDGKSIDWVLVRNRLSALGSRNGRSMQEGLEAAAPRLGCRIAEGISERVIFRALFATGMTVFDPLEADMLGGIPSMSHVSARQEYRALVQALKLPVNERAKARLALREASAATREKGAGFDHMA
jgi:chromosome partitioning protein